MSGLRGSDAEQRRPAGTSIEDLWAIVDELEVLAGRQRAWIGDRRAAQGRDAAVAERRARLRVIDGEGP